MGYNIIYVEHVWSMNIILYAYMEECGPNIHGITKNIIFGTTYGRPWKDEVDGYYMSEYIKIWKCRQPWT